MSYQVLYRTYRPSKFSEVVGQDYIVKTLVNAINNNKIAHAYLFAGPRGTGKTTIAKLFAKAINCENFKGESCDKCDSCDAYVNSNHPDIIEMDAASNNGIDDIRDIIEQVPYAPLLGKYKVYIIDEVHMLSTQAFNALLKTLEEPPAHVVFILATTDPQKVLPTVLSRCQRYNFSRITTNEIIKRSSDILNKENIPFEDKALEIIARKAEGGMRDALSLLEQILAYNPKELKVEDIEKVFGIASTDKEVELYQKIYSNQVDEVVRELRSMYQQGMDGKQLAIDILEIIKDSLIYSDKANKELLNKLSSAEAQNIIKNVSKSDLLKDAQELQNVLSKDKQNQSFITYLELCFIKMANKNSQPTVQEIKEEPQTKQETPVPTTEIKKENIGDVVVPDKDLLLGILLDASKDLKLNDQIIYNKLDLYLYEPDKRKFYQLLIGTEIFASNKDAIIICGDKSQADNINSKIINEELYNFVNKEFGIDKMIYGVSIEEKQELIEMYKSSPKEKRNKPVYVPKYETKQDTPSEPQDKVKDLFGDIVKVEE